MPRFIVHGAPVRDHRSGLLWSRNANPAEFPMYWHEVLDFVARLGCERWLGRADWRLPTRHELRSLVSYQTRRQARPAEHPFLTVFPSLVLDVDNRRRNV